MQHFYDNQIRRYLLQMVRMMSNFNYTDGNRNERQIPVAYGDMSRQVANLISQNSEASMPSIPRMAVYVTGLAIDDSRRGDSSYVNKLHIRERRYDSAGNEYLEQEGKNYTVERLMPTPYTLTMNVDIWSSNTDQKLQILEQILVLFNPSLELQTTDNYVDWTSLTTVRLTNVNWSSRSIPSGTDDAIDISTLTFETPIFINPPAKVKRLGVITNIIASVFTEDTGNVVNGLTKPEINQYKDSDTLNTNTNTVIKSDGNSGIVEERTNEGISIGEADAVIGINYQAASIVVLNNTATLQRGEGLPDVTWEGYINALPFHFKDYVTTIKLRRADTGYEISGTVSLSSSDPRELDINFDTDSTPSDTLLEGENGTRGTVDYIVNPRDFDPRNVISESPRILLLEAINTSVNVGQDVGSTPNNYVYDGPDAWKNADGSDFVAGANDIVEWTGTKWNVVFDASVASLDSTIIYTTNINTNIQYKFDPDEGEWYKAFDGIYHPGTWRLDYN